MKENAHCTTVLLSSVSYLSLPRVIPVYVSVTCQCTHRPIECIVMYNNIEYTVVNSLTILSEINLCGYSNCVLVKSESFQMLTVCE